MLERKGKGYTATQNRVEKAAWKDIIFKNSSTCLITLLLLKNFPVCLLFNSICRSSVQVDMTTKVVQLYVGSNSSLLRTWLTCPTHPIFGSVGPAFTTVLHNLKTFSRFNRKIVGNLHLAGKSAESVMNSALSIEYNYVIVFLFLTSFANTYHF